MNTLRPPPIILLQMFNALAGAALYLVVVQVASALGAAGWTSWQIGLCIAGANAVYGLLVGLGGRLAERIGRARASIGGALLGLAGCGVLMASQDPWVAVTGMGVVFAAAAVFFPGNAGLFSDSAPADGATVPLHVKVAKYNLGWSIGNMAGMALGGILGADGRFAAYAIGAGAFLAVIAGLWRWRALPPQPPRPDGDRAAHPALNRLIFLGRSSLLLFCLIGMATIGLADKAIRGTWPGADAQRLAAWLLASYAAGYFLMFIVLGRWSGWVLRPLRLLATSAGLPVAIGILAWAAFQPAPCAYLLAAAGLALGSAYAAIYTGSIYYSLRLPDGASAAASRHETYLGIGSTLGPVLGGSFLALFAETHALAALALWQAVVMAAILLWQVAIIPGARRLGAR